MVCITTGSNRPLGPVGSVARRELVCCYEWQQCDVTCALNGNRQTALLVLLQASLFAGLYLAKLVYIALQGLEVLVVKICYVCLVFKNLRHNILERRQTYGFYRRTEKRSTFISRATLFSSVPSPILI